MPVERFLDTNILLYAYDLDEPEKRPIASSLIREAWVRPGSCAVSIQVLQEFHVNFVRKGNPVSESAELVGDYHEWLVIDNTLKLFQSGLGLQARWKLSLWDSMILAAAHSSGAKALLTEDFKRGQDYGGVRAMNPFI